MFVVLVFLNPKKKIVGSDKTIIKLGKTESKAGRALRSTSNQSSEPCRVVQHPKQKQCITVFCGH